MKLWLLDLANELAAGARAGSMPTLGLDRVWLRNDGHLVLFDFPPPAVGPISRERLDRADQTPVGLLSAVATRGLSMAANTPRQPVEVLAGSFGLTVD